MPTQAGVPVSIEDSAICSPLSEENLKVILESAQDFFSRQVGSVVNDLIEQLLEKQRRSPAGIVLGLLEMRELAARYAGAVRRSTGNLAKELAQAVGVRQGLGGEQKQWIERQLVKSVENKTSRETVSAFLGYAISDQFHITNQVEAEATLAQSLAELAGGRLLLLQADYELRHAGAIYGQKETESLPTEALRAGRFCAEFLLALRTIRHSYPASTMSEIKSRFQNLPVWQKIEQSEFDDEDRDVFYHPNRWGPTVGYGTMLLAKLYGRSPHTIKRWVKAYRRYSRTSRKQE